MSKEKSQWLRRLELLKSLDLESVAREITRRREAERLSKPDRKSDELPRDQRADAVRMKRALLAIHQIAGNNRTWICTVKKIAEEMHAGERTARRAVSDLEDACLCEVTRRERARRSGGQGPNQYLIVWPNLKDIAHTQGLQSLLCFDEAEAESSAGAVIGQENDRPDGPSGPHQTPRGRAPGHSGRAPGHSGRAPGHSGRAPGHSGRALRGARAPVPSSFSFFNPLPPSPLAREEEGEDLIWKGLRGRLAAYGVGNARDAITDARRHGWTAEQIGELLSRCEREVCGDTKAFGPGAIYQHLARAEPGSPIRYKPAEAYLRAKRDRDRRNELARQAERTAPRKRKGNPLEAKWGELLDGLSAQETRELLDAADLEDFAKAEAIRQAFAGPGQRFGYARVQLLQVLDLQHQEPARKPPE